MLRPVPSRPPGPVDPAEALAFVAASLPALDSAAQTAFSLVVLGGQPRSSVPELSGDEVSVALARARKLLRRAAYPLPGSGWCERAERLLSDRLDDELEDSRLLDAHLANCERCVEHERRVVQVQDTLMASFVSSAGLTQPATSPEPPPELTVVVAPAPAVVEPEPSAPRASRSASGLAWAALAVMAVLLTVAAIAVAIAGVLGAL